MTHGVLVPGGRDVATFARRAERLGYGTVWMGELWGRDAFVSLARAAEATEGVGLGTGIVNAYSRSPATLAAAAATLAAAADGRFVLGVGTSTEKAVEDLHGAAFDNPPRRLHETVELTKRFLAGDGRVEYRSDLFEVRDFPALRADVPVYAAALGPATRRATGRVADGWMPHNVPFDRLDEAFEVVARAARSVDRSPGDVAVVPHVPSAVSEDPREALDAVRGHVAYYVGNGAGYRRAVATSFPDEAERISTAWNAGERAEARSLVTDEMVDALGVAGDAATAVERLDAVRSLDVVDDVAVVVPAGASAQLTDRTVEALAPNGG